MPTASNQEGRYFRPDGLPLGIMVVSCALLGLSLIAVSLRTYARLSRNLFRLDDGLIVGGTVSLLGASKAQLEKLR